MAKIKKEEIATEVTESTVDPNDQLLFGRINYIIVLIGILFIIVGFIAMAGGGSSDPNVFDADAIYSPRRITLAPILILIGFAIEIYAIVKKP
ncbi:MAG: DUF3098 domain-containing protein [Bacteroidetes bacterium]|nr:DUF3098 domain-containing protein [Bacteroidota bacterium]